MVSEGYVGGRDMLVAAQNNGQSFSKDLLVAGQEGPVFSEGQVDDRRLARAGERVDDIRLTTEGLPALCSG